MQIGRHRRRGGHGVGQPEMERKLRALGESAQQQQNKGREVQRVIAHLLAGSKHMIEVVAAHNVADDQHAPQQAQAARAGDGERHARAAPRIAPVVPVADQQEGKQAGQLPEEHNLDDVAQIQKKLSDVVLQGGQYLAGSAFLIGKGTFGFAISFGIMLYLLFLLLKDGPYLVRQILDSLPLSDFAKQHLFAKFVGVTRATVKGTAVVALVQGILGGIAFAIVDIDGSVLWGALMAFLSLVPAVGSAIVWVPAAIFLFATHQLWQGLFIVGFFVIIVGLVDNILRPLLVGKDTKMPDYLILITTLGGMEIYGINGFVIGPLIAALFITCWNLFSGRDHEGNVEGIDEAFMEEGKNPPDL